MPSSRRRISIMSIVMIFGILLSLCLGVYLVIEGTGGFKSRAASPRPPIAPFKPKAVPKKQKNCGDLPFNGMGATKCADFCPCPKIGGADYFCSFGRCLKRN